jgi:hypothetical protein
MKTFLVLLITLCSLSVYSQQSKVNGCYVSLIKPNSDELAWENDTLKFTFTPYTYYWNIKIENKINNKMTCLWDETLFIVKNRSSRIVFSNTLKIDVNKPKGEDILFPGTEIRKSILPVEKVQYGTMNNIFYRSDVRKADVPIKLVFPIKIDETVRDYEFEFNVTSK